MAPRQVPIPGLHTKWLNSHRPALTNLSDRTDLGLVAAAPVPVHFTYLDAAYLAAGRRRHNTASTGDAMTPAYAPRGDHRRKQGHCRPLPSRSRRDSR